MDDLGTFLPPLSDVYDVQFQALCEALWGWASCAHCSFARPCIGADCPHRRLLRLEPFFQFYKQVSGSYVPESFMPDDARALNCHQDLIDLLRLLNEKPAVSRDELRRLFFSTRASSSADGSTKDFPLPPLDDQHRALNLAMRIIAMVSCSIENQGSGLLESGIQPLVWRSDQSPRDFIAATFPAREHPSLNDEDDESVDIREELLATKLKALAGVKFEGTAELREHLRLDPRTGIVKLYHFTSVLKEHLRATVDLESCENNEGLVNRQLALETLDSLQILFPLASDSQRLLRSLVSKQSFDPDCLRFGAMAYRRGDEDRVIYQYWGSRLMDLFDEIENPKPRGFLQTWLSQRSQARHVMLATLVGVFIAIILGFLGLAVTIVQTWISYQAWKHPVPTK